ncbi:MAG: hypothetical protein KBT14_04200, partial [Proteobacteria bacterium]|nr:hypothetical protein [Candidatus Enterousia onthequi]
KYRESKKLSKKHIFLSIFSKITIFVCVFCAFFISPVFATLPAGYTELEYIESTGTQYIDTGLKPNNNTKITAYFKSTNTSVTQALIGARNTSSGDDRRSFTVWENVSGKMRFDYGASGQINQGDISTTDWNYVVKENKDNYLNETKLNSNPEITFTCDYPLMINAVNTAGTKGNIGTTTFGVVEIYQNGTDLSFKGIPAKRISDNVVGMYDIANSGKNLFDGIMEDGNIGNDGQDTGTASTYYRSKNYTEIKPSTTYQFSFNTSIVNGQFYIIDYDKDKNFISRTPYNDFIREGGRVGGYTSSANTKFIRFFVYSGSPLPHDVITWVQMEKGSTVTSYEPYPFYTNAGTGTFIAGPEKSITDIQIATTKFVDEEFKAAEAKLATTVQTIESVVSRTIAQTGQIQILQDNKQTRPDESCPANMKCLLVQDEDGTPHWYPIIEP